MVGALKKGNRDPDVEECYRTTITALSTQYLGADVIDIGSLRLHALSPRRPVIDVSSSSTLLCVGTNLPRARARASTRLRNVQSTPYDSLLNSLEAVFNILPHSLTFLKMCRRLRFPPAGNPRKMMSWCFRKHSAIQRIKLKMVSRTQSVEFGFCSPIR
jgi:hypothetical protein